MRNRAAQFFQDWRIHWCSLRFYGDAEDVARANRVGKTFTAASALASSLEHESKQRELSSAARGGGALLTGRSQTMPSSHRSLYGQRQNPARCLRQDRHGGVRWNE